ncbi:MAG: HEAT repeat domain-containing protein [Candidatus Xenobiia bacterium LiM19]
MNHRYLLIISAFCLLIVILSGCKQASGTQSLIENLNHADQSVKDKAEADLIKEGDSVIQPLIKVLSDSSAPYESRRRAAKILGEIKAEQAIPALISSLSESLVRESSLEALKKIGDPGVKALIDALKTTAGDDQIAVIECLGALKDKRAIEPLCAFSVDSSQSENARFQAQEALKLLSGGDLPSKVLVTEIISLPDPAARVEAAMELKRRKDVKSIDSALNSLAKSKGDTAVTTLLIWYSKDSSPVQRKKIAAALEKAGSKSVSPVAAEYLSNNEKIDIIASWMESGSPILKAAATKWAGQKSASLSAAAVEKWIGSSSPALRKEAQKWVNKNLDVITADEWLAGKSPALQSSARQWVSDNSSRLDAVNSEQWLNCKSPLIREAAQKWINSAPMTESLAMSWVNSSNPMMLNAASKWLKANHITPKIAQEWLNGGNATLQNLAREWVEEKGYSIRQMPKKTQ